MRKGKTAGVLTQGGEEEKAGAGRRGAEVAVAHACQKRPTKASRKRNYVSPVGKRS